MLKRLLPEFLFLSRYSPMQRASALLTMLLPWCLLAGNAPADVAISLVGLMFLVESALRRDWGWLRQPWVYCLGVLMLYMLGRSLFAEYPDKALIRSLTFLRYPLFALALSCWVWRVTEMQKLLFYSLTSSVIFLFFDCFLQYATGQDIVGREIVISESSPRLTGPFSAPKVGIHLVWLTFPVLAVIVSHAALSTRWRENTVGVLFVMLFLTVIFITGERMAMLLTIFGCVLFFLAYPPLRKAFTVMVLFGLLAVSLFAQYNPALVTRQYFSTVNTIEKTQGSAYGQIWQSAFSIVEANPVFGVGPKHFRYACPDERYGDSVANPHRCNLHPHQLYLEWAVETGLLGLLLFIVMVSCLLTPILTHYPKLKKHPLYAGLLIALIIRLWPLSTSISFFANWSAIPFWLVAGWLLAIVHDASRRDAGANKKGIF